MSTSYYDTVQQQQGPGRPKGQGKRPKLGRPIPKPGRPKAPAAPESFERDPRARPLDELPAATRELIDYGPFSQSTITKQPATRAELLRELNSLHKEVCRAERRLAQIETELLTAN